MEAKMSESGLQVQLHQATLTGDAEVVTDLPAAQTVSKTSAPHWLNISGKASLADLQLLLGEYRLHALVLEDMASKNQRAKIEDYGDYVFLVLRGVLFQDNQLKTQLLYLIIGKDFLISYQPKTLLMRPVMKQRIAQKPLWYQQSNLEYLMYLYIDCWVDTLMASVETFSVKVDKLDGSLLQIKDTDLLPRLHRMKHDAMRLRRSVVPLRDVLTVLMRSDFEVLSDRYHLYMRDTFDHCMQLMENLDFSRDALLTMMEVTLGSQSNRLNRQMRLLTAVSIIFMPLTLITGIYGMNFDNMPELHWQYGYFYVLGTIAIIAISSIVFLTYRKWL